MHNKSTLSYLTSQAAKNYPKLLNFVTELNKQPCMEDFGLSEVMVLVKCCHGLASHNWPKSDQLADFVEQHFEDEVHGWNVNKESLVKKVRLLDEDIASYIFYTVLSYPKVREKE